MVIGASIRYGTFIRRWTAFVKKHLAALQALPGAFFSVNLVARKPEKRTPQTNSYTRKFLLNSPWQPQSWRGIWPARCATRATAGTIGL
ncbi:protoporphyrinogen oxidase [Klebsiella pneumoniae subsp. pneumoniae]|nr:protoporphyrinogen oxidase [Klebsiella pneumoniae subsp. pneumoniae]